MQAAIAAHKQGKMDEAEAKGKKALALSPKDPNIHVFLAYVYLEQDKGKEASEAFAAALKLKPTDKGIYFVKAQVDSLRGATADALKAVRKAIELDPRYAEAHELLGQLLEHDDSQAAKAISAYQTALSINPALYKSHEGLAKLFDYQVRKTGEQQYLKTAEEHFKKSIELDPKHAAGRFDLGRMFVEQGRLVEARELWEGRTSEEDDIRPTFIAMLERAENLKRTTEAATQRPNDPVALVDLGFATMVGDSWVVDLRQERAIVHFKKALELKPDYARAQYGIVKAYIELANVRPGKIKDVDREMVKLRKLDPKLADEMLAYRKNYQGELIAPAFKQ